MTDWKLIRKRAHTALSKGMLFGYLAKYTKAATQELGLKEEEAPSLARLVSLIDQLFTSPPLPEKAGEGSVEISEDETDFPPVTTDLPLPELDLSEPLPELVTAPQPEEAPLVEAPLSPEPAPEPILPAVEEESAPLESAPEPSEGEPSTEPVDPLPTKKGKGKKSLTSAADASSQPEA